VKPPISKTKLCKCSFNLVSCGEFKPMLCRYHIFMISTNSRFQNWANSFISF
jgi:hypothetical protein